MWTVPAPDDREVAAVIPADSTIYRSGSDSLVLAIGPGSSPAQLTAAITLLSQASHGAYARLVLDVAHVHVLSSDLVALLLWAKLQLQSRGAQLVVARPTRATRDLLERTGLNHVLPVLDELPGEVAA